MPVILPLTQILQPLVLWPCLLNSPYVQPRCTQAASQSGQGGVILRPVLLPLGSVFVNSLLAASLSSQLFLLWVNPEQDPSWSFPGTWPDCLLSENIVAQAGTVPFVPSFSFLSPCRY